MSKFDVGDRVKGDGIVTDDAVHVVSWTDGERLRIDGRVDQQWLVSRFKLYAKAGEFVVGDVVVVTKDGEDDAPTGAMFTVTGTGRGYGDLQTVDFTDNNGDGREWLSDRFRLATPKEIVAAELAAPRFGDVDPSIVIEPKPFGKFFTILGEPDPGPQPIPAADFDFSTIKAGDEIVVRLRVTADGVDRDDEIKTINGCRQNFHRFFRRDEVVSVIPAPKPKTLRERAIEAAVKATDHFDNGMAVAAIVDAVLAEVEKG